VLSWIGQTGPESFRLFYAVSKDGGQTFGKPQSIPTSVGVYPHDENLSKLIWKKNGEMLAVFAVSNPNEQNAYAGLLYYTQSFDGEKPGRRAGNFHQQKPTASTYATSTFPCCPTAKSERCGWIPGNRLPPTTERTTKALHCTFRAPKAGRAL
jgi:hypothetical protein